MTSDTKKQSSPKPVRVMDERDPVWSSVKDLTVGLDPKERAKALMQFVGSLKKTNA